MKKIIFPILLSMLLLFGGCQTAPVNDPPQAEDPVQTGKEFASSEVEGFFAMTETQMEELFGKPLNETEEVGGFRMAQYENASVLYGDGYIARIELRGGSDLLMRGIQIGDSLSSVREKFPDEGNEPFYVTEGESENYIVLYGEYVHMSPYGILHRWDEEAKAIEVADNDMSATFQFTDDKVSNILYLLAA